MKLSLRCWSGERSQLDLFAPLVSEPAVNPRGRCERLGNARLMRPGGPLRTPSMWGTFKATENCDYA